MARSSFDPIPFEVRKHSHTQLMRSGLMACIALGGDGGDSDSEPDHDGGHGSDGDGNWSGD